MKRWVFLLGVVAVCCACSATPKTSTQPPYPIDKEALRDMLSQPDVMIIDVRTPKDWKNSDLMILGAVRHAPEDFKNWAGSLDRGKQLVFY
jgi:rhodanese-related sulfurtransferase